MNGFSGFIRLKTSVVVGRAVVRDVNGVVVHLIDIYGVGADFADDVQQLHSSIMVDMYRILFIMIEN